ncbi:MAG: NAD(P)H-hydrate epimerase, partial [Planctomycetia bacterium]|nr:NAD(P)H-hydrate epimerase [Planctomycetia bacterium]
FVMARRLQLLGISTEVVALGDPNKYQNDAAIQLNILRASNQSPNSVWFFDSGEEAWDRLKEGMECADWLVDALLGTGSHGALRSPYDQMIAKMNDSGKPIFAVDIPSGLDPEKGTASGPVIRARATCTLAVMKTALLEESAKEFTGILNVGDIGISVEHLFD